MSSTNEIGSFAVLDLETTGLPGHNFNKANITELAIHGFASEDVRNATTSDIPRINHKLSLIFNPRMIIHPKAEEITGLSNYSLEHESFLDTNAANLIVSFLKHLRQPVCLVAHNGDKFDFPIFKQSLEKHNCELPKDIVCIDSLVAIKELDKIAQEKDDEVIGFSQEEEIAVLPSVEESIPLETKTKSDTDDEKPSDWQKLNETTPKRPPSEVLVGKRKPVHLDGGEKTASPVKRTFKSRRSLFQSPKQTGNTAASMFGSYKLVSIYTRLFGEDPEIAHHAEADVVTLKKVILHYGKSFVEYCEENAKPYADVKKVGSS